jgi:hypothetical protein
MEVPLEQGEMLRNWKDGLKGLGHYPVLPYRLIILDPVSLLHVCGVYADGSSREAC